MSEANLYLRKDGTRECRECSRGRSAHGGGVYFIDGGDVVKIGYSANVGDRLRTLKRERGDKNLKLITRFDAAIAVERGLHKWFIADRVEGEWFRKSESLMAFIDQVAKDPGNVEIPFTLTGSSHLNVDINEEAMRVAKENAARAGMLLKKWIERLILDTRSGESGVSTRKPLPERTLAPLEDL